MSTDNGACQYVLDPEEPETWGGTKEDECLVDDAVLNEDGVWTCPYDAEGDNERCIYHLPLDEKDEAQVRNAFVTELDSRLQSETESEDDTRQFLGGIFGSLELSSFDGMEHVPGDLRLSYADFEGSVNLSDMDFEGSVSFAGVTFRPKPSSSDGSTEVSFQRATFTGDISFDGAIFNMGGNFFNVTFEGDVSFTHAYSERILGFNQAIFKAHSTFEGTVFRRDVSFSQASFEDSVTFRESTFADAEIPDGMYQFDPTARFEGTAFEAQASFDASTFEVETDFKFATFGERANFWHSTFVAEADFSRATFDGDADFKWSTFEASVNFFEAGFSETADFSSVDLSDQRFEEADLTDADFSGATLHRANFESALLSRATISGADLRGARLSGAVIGDVRVDGETRFLGHPNDDHNSPHTISAIRSSQPCVYDPLYTDEEYADTDTAKTVYRTLEELGRRTGRSRLQARCFVRRQDLQKNGYWNDATAADATIEERIVAGARWWRSAVARAMLLYGESPWRVIAYSIFTVLGFALLYPLGGWMQPTGGDPIRYDGLSSLAELGNSLYYSTLTFTALGFGDFQPVGFGRVLTTIETSLGAVLLALLVFILGRRAAR